MPVSMLRSNQQSPVVRRLGALTGFATALAVGLSSCSGQEPTGNPEPGQAETSTGQATGRTISDDFSDPDVNTELWELYGDQDGTGWPATNGGKWHRSQVSVKNGALTLSVDGDKLAALCLCGPEAGDMTYGDVSFDLKQITPNKSVNFVAMLWPREKQPDGSIKRTDWPTEGELDFFESFDPLRKTGGYNIWWVDEPGNDDLKVQLRDNSEQISKYPNFAQDTPVDFTKPQRIEVKWRPDVIEIHHGDKLVFRTDDPKILDTLDGPMHLVLQTDMTSKDAVNSTPVKVEIDNVKMQGLNDNSFSLAG